MQTTDAVPVDEPMRDTLLRPVNQLQSLARALFETLSSSQTPPDPPVGALAACDEQLAEALRKSRIHLLKQRRIEALLAEVHDLDVQLLEIVETLGHGQKELAAVIEEGGERVRAADEATKCPCSQFQSLLGVSPVPQRLSHIPL
jgi:mediator of RNA polymerase II transcription subunit 4